MCHCETCQVLAYIVINISFQSRTVAWNVLVGSVSFAAMGPKAMHNASTAQEVTIITPSAANFEFRVREPLLPSLSRIVILISLVSAGVTHPQCHPAPFKAMILRGLRQKRIRNQTIPPASRRLVDRRPIKRRRHLPAQGGVGSVQTGSLLSILSQGSPYALRLSSTGSRWLARLYIAPTTVSCPQLKSWAGPSSIS
jgi:hypothetical protein